VIGLGSTASCARWFFGPIILTGRSTYFGLDPSAPNQRARHRRVSHLLLFTVIVRLVGQGHHRAVVSSALQKALWNAHRCPHDLFRHQTKSLETIFAQSLSAALKKPRALIDYPRKGVWGAWFYFDPAKAKSPPHGGEGANLVGFRYRPTPIPRRDSCCSLPQREVTETGTGSGRMQPSW